MLREAFREPSCSSPNLAFPKAQRAPRPLERGQGKGVREAATELPRSQRSPKDHGSKGTMLSAISKSLRPSKPVTLLLAIVKSLATGVVPGAAT